ncbi:NAD(P)-dependent oxidoreductase [Brevibacterium casei]|uniref:NAD(P)-dependent oxidoreductase n=1 Tax=Brevibacterium casei TaxID=33889 RepID=UPI0036FEA2CE
MSSTLFIGLGRMGAPMAIQHARSFHTVVFDLASDTAERVAAKSDAVVLSSLSDIPDAIDTIILMLPSSREVEELLVGRGDLLTLIKRDSIIIDMGSSEPESTRRLAAQAGGLGIAYVDAPVSGGVPKAATGELSILVGGADAHVARALPHLRTMGSKIIHVGDVGTGDVAKAVNNLVSATNIAVACEALSIAESSGISRERMAEVLNSSTGRSQASELKLTEYVIPRNFTSGFAYDLMLKDMAIAVGLETSTRTPVTRSAFDVLKRGRGSLGTEPDHTEIGRLYRLGDPPIAGEGLSP